MKRLFNFLNSNDVIFMAIIFFAVLGAIFSNKMVLTGDGTEYMMETQTLFFDHSLKFSDNVLKRFIINKPSELITGGYLVNKGLNGNSYFTQHPIYYPLISVPLYGLFNSINKKLAFFSFSVTNLCLLMVVFVALIYYFKKLLKFDKYLYLIFSLIFASTIFPYIFWQHPETFIFFNITLFFFFLYILKKPIISSIFLGIAVGQSLLLCFLAINLAYYLLFLEKPRIKRIFVSFFIFFILASFHYFVTFVLTGHFFSLYNFSTISLLAMKDIVYEIFDPAVGLIWFYPMVIFSVFFIEKKIKNFLILFSVLICMIFYMVNNQFYTHQIAIRYLNYLYPAFFFILDIKKVRKHIALVVVFILISFFLTSGINTNLTLTNATMDPTNKSLTAYRFFSKALFPYYKEHPAFFIYHASLLNNKVLFEDPWKSFKLYGSNDGGNIYSEGKWIINNNWVRFMMNPIESGNLKIKLEQDCNKSEVIFNNKHLLFNSKVIDIKIEPNMIGHTDKRDMYIFFSDYVYLDLKIIPSCGFSKISEITNKDKKIYINL